LRGEDSRVNIFSPFIRKKTSRGIQGSGLGLNILKEIADKHGGEVWLEPGLESGITFYLSIPKNIHCGKEGQKNFFQGVNKHQEAIFDKAEQSASRHSKC
jgi:signal transduction histidine kinase